MAFDRSTLRKSKLGKIILRMLTKGEIISINVESIIFVRKQMEKYNDSDQICAFTASVRA